MSLKGVIFGVENVLFNETSSEKFGEVVKLMRFLQSKGLQIAVLTNRDRLVGTQKMDDVFAAHKLTAKFFIHNRDHNVPKKPSSSCVPYVLEEMNWSSSECIYVGQNDADMLTAVNGGVLFLNAQWYEASQTYGLPLKSPKSAARFVDIFCLRNYWWHYTVKNANVEFYSLGPYGTREEKYSVISNDAREAAKSGTGHPKFWIQYLLSSVYFTGLKFDYIATYPASSTNGRKTNMETTIELFGKCFRTKFLPDLITRHTASTKSAFARARGDSVDHENQLNTIQLTKLPRRSSSSFYKASPLGSGKTVLIIDDFCTQGHSLESARYFIKQTGAKTIGISLLKTLYKGYREIEKTEPNKFDPYKPNRFSDVDFIEHTYQDGLVQGTEIEIREKLEQYVNWAWPQGL